MSSVQNFYTSRDNNTDPVTYVGQLDRLWYNPTTNSIFVSDGVTPGGAPVALATNANIVANIVTVNTVTSTTGNITVTGNLIISGNISPATETKIGGIKAGPGANVSNDGTLTIDTAGLPLSFGDFTANLNILTLVNEDQNMILATNGNAEVQLVGNMLVLFKLLEALQAMLLNLESAAHCCTLLVSWTLRVVCIMMAMVIM